MADLVRELAPLKYGGGISDILGEIGAGIRERKNLNEAKQVLSDLTGVDLTTPEGKKKFAESIFGLSQLGQPGKNATEAVQTGIIEPIKLEDTLQNQKLNRFKNETSSFEKDNQQLHQDLRSGIDITSRIPQLEKTRQYFIQKYPEFAGALSELPTESMIKSLKGRGSDYQEKGITERGSLTVVFDKKQGKNVVNTPDGMVDYDPNKFGNIIQTAVPQTIYQPQVNLTGGGLDLAVKTYIQTGQMPLGFGAPTLRAKILTKAAEEMSKIGLQPSMVPAIQADYKALSGALSALEKQYNSVITFENTAERNLDIALKQSNIVDRWQSPILNKWKLWVQGKVQGDANVNAFDAAVHVAANEIAKVTSTTTGNQIPEQEREEYRKLMSTALNSKGFKGVTDILKQDMNSRRIGYNDQIKEIRSQLNKPFFRDLEDSTIPNEGDVRGGYRFKGGDPNKQENWEKFP